MKHLYYLFGITATGKTTVGPKLAELLGAGFIESDEIYGVIRNEINDPRYGDVIDPEAVAKFPEKIQAYIRYRTYELYKQMWPNTERVVIEGSCCTLPTDRSAAAECIGEGFAETFFWIDLKFDDWIAMVAKKYGVGLADLDKTRDLWEERWRALRRKLVVPIGTYVFGHAEDVLVPAPEPYQRKGLTDVKWKLMKMPDDFAGASVLDLGCNAGEIGGYCLEHKAGKVLGIDTNWRLLDQARALGVKVQKFNLNAFGDFKERFDYVLCLSMLHYISDQEAFIRKLSRLAKDTLVIEVPVAQNGEDYEQAKDGQFCGRCPSKELVESWLSKHFSNFALIGKSVSPDSYTKRLIWKAHMDEKDVWTRDWNDAAATNPMAAVAAVSDARVFRATGIVDAARVISSLVTLLGGHRFLEMSILEHGCGMGRMTTYLRPFFKTYHCVDISQGMLDLAKQAAPEADDFTLCKIDSLDVAPASVDLIFSFAVLMHNRKANILPLMLEFKRILTPGGYLLFQLPVYITGTEARAYNEVSIWTLNELTRLAQDTGMEIIKIAACNRPMTNKISDEHFDLHIFRRPVK
jgi:SAM-dependent methyltransferase/shikimate kinase